MFALPALCWAPRPRGLSCRRSAVSWACPLFGGHASLPACHSPLLLTPDLQTANAFEKKLTLSLGADVLTSVYSFLSLTERSEYLSTEQECIESLKNEGIAEGSPQWEERIAEIRQRLDKYLRFRLY